MKAIIQNPAAILISGLLCFAMALYLAYNMYRTRSLQRSTPFIKSEFLLLSVLLLIFLHHMAACFNISIAWLSFIAEIGYTPIGDLLLVLAVLFINLFINQRWKKRAII